MPRSPDQNILALQPPPQRLRKVPADVAGGSFAGVSHSRIHLHQSLLVDVDGQPIQLF